MTVAVGGIVDVLLYDDARMGSWLPPISDQMGLIQVVTDIDCPSDAVCATFTAIQPGVWLITATPPGHGPPTSNCADCGSYALLQLKQNVIALR